MTIATRQSIYALQKQYDDGSNTKPLEDVLFAWMGIQKLGPQDWNSFFVLAGLHGEPFVTRDAVDRLQPEDIYAYWGGYCNHGNILFPTWHRMYLYALEKALQSIVPGVMLPFWDETDEYSLTNGVPSIFTRLTVDLPNYGLMNVANPLLSYTMPTSLSDDYWGDQSASTGEAQPYYKPLGYTTVRYPLSGLVGNFGDYGITEAHNKGYSDPAVNAVKLDDNIKAWLNGPEPETHHGQAPPPGSSLYAAFAACLAAPNYVVFSNTTSAAAWNASNPDKPQVVSLEEPHNDIHLAVGGFDAPQIYAGMSTGQIPGANGDMGENNTAAFDPIFFFHHCNVDRMFWNWQKLHNQTSALTIPDELKQGYPGTNSSDTQGPTPGFAPGTSLTLNTTALKPFRGPTGLPAVSTDCVDIGNLGYDYGPGSLETLPTRGSNFAEEAVKAGFSAKRLTVRGIDRATFQGSFLLTAHATVKGADGTHKELYLGYHSVFSRYSVSSCANCRTHLEVIAHFPLHKLLEEELSSATFSVRVHHRGTALPASFKHVHMIHG